MSIHLHFISFHYHPSIIFFFVHSSAAFLLNYSLIFLFFSSTLVFCFLSFFQIQPFATLHFSLPLFLYASSISRISVSLFLSPFPYITVTSKYFITLYFSLGLFISLNFLTLSLLRILSFCLFVSFFLSPCVISFSSTFFSFSTVFSLSLLLFSLSKSFPSSFPSPSPSISLFRLLSCAVFLTSLPTFSEILYFLSALSLSLRHLFQYFIISFSSLSSLSLSLSLNSFFFSCLSLPFFIFSLSNFPSLS
ncbi:unnamed protein product [Acanthosepion pharaonis]|uniref:Uncharacterized protein n=1 Tax=Acanthosepion pharaonis TaxID=158019 RepID=A0A812CMY4_ACAPH|nr:unnamed protein product [Sepia pharaonis]